MNASMDTLSGRWRSGERDTELGPSYLELAFGPEHALSADIVFTEGGERLTAAGKYRVEDGLLVSDALNRGAPFKVDLEGDVLTLDDGKEAIKYTRLPSRGA